MLFNNGPGLYKNERYFTDLLQIQLSPIRFELAPCIPCYWHVYTQYLLFIAQYDP